MTKEGAYSKIRATKNNKRYWHMASGWFLKHAPQDRKEGEAVPEKQALMLVRELIASQFYQYLLGADGAPAYRFVAGSKFAEHTLESELVMDATDVEAAMEDDDAKVSRAAMALKKTTIATHLGLLAEIAAASYLLAETDFNLGSLLFIHDGVVSSRWKKMVKIDHDHSLHEWRYFPLDLAMEQENLAVYLFQLMPPDEEGCAFLNWAPSSDFQLDMRPILKDPAQVAAANAQALEVFSKFGCLNRETIQSMVDSAGLPGDVVASLPSGALTEIIETLAKRAEQAQEFSRPAMPAPSPETVAFSTGLCFACRDSSTPSVASTRLSSETSPLTTHETAPLGPAY